MVVDYYMLQLLLTAAVIQLLPVHAPCPSCSRKQNISPIISDIPWSSPRQQMLLRCTFATVDNIHDNWLVTDVLKSGNNHW